VLDTNVLSEPLKQRPDEHVLAWFAPLDAEAGVTAVSMGELLTGVWVLPVGRHRQRHPSDSAGLGLDLIDPWAASSRPAYGTREPAPSGGHARRGCWQLG
jgi:predicted nucleic acid-binding protein